MVNQGRNAQQTVRKISFATVMYDRNQSVTKYTTISPGGVGVASMEKLLICYPLESENTFLPGAATETQCAQQRTNNGIARRSCHTFDNRVVDHCFER